jgi:hypothetical protein
MSDSDELYDMPGRVMERRIITTDDVSSDDDSEIFGEGFTLASREVKKRMMAAAASRVREGAPRASLTEAGPGVTCSASGGGPTHVDIKVRAAHRTLTRHLPASLPPAHRHRARPLDRRCRRADADADAEAAAAPTLPPPPPPPPPSEPPSPPLPAFSAHLSTHRPCPWPRVR